MGLIDTKPAKLDHLVNSCCMIQKMNRWSNLSCDNTEKSGEYLVKINQCPGFFLDFPFNDRPGEIDYAVSEFKEIISFLEKSTGKKMNCDRLSEIVRRLNYQISLIKCRNFSKSLRTENA